MPFGDIKETKRHKNTWTDNVKTVYPPTNTDCGKYKAQLHYGAGGSVPLFFMPRQYNLSEVS